jgi:phosphate:Na+ symporter
MTQDFFTALGGIGMFLLGMDVMTTALRDAAGRNLRQLLSRYTTTPLRGVLTGAAATAVIQSSSATTVMTVGFVGAGLLTLQQALGVIFGANIGTTATGWLVSVLGFKLALGSVALILLLPASLVLLLAKGPAALAGRILAGLCLLLIGLDMMQSGVGDMTGLITPRMLPSGGFIGVLVLIVIGMVVTALIQSSSAAVAMALVLLNSGAISLDQAAAVVIGMNIGTTFTALLASVGGSRAMRQTAVANLVFNLATSALAIPLLMFGSDTLAAIAAASGPLTALLAFHSGFNLVGTAVFLPVSGRFAAMIGRLVPDPAGADLIVLDDGLLRDADAALFGAQAASGKIAVRLFAALGAALQDKPDLRALSTLPPTIGPALDDLEAFLARLRLNEGNPSQAAAFSALLHQADHLRRLLERSQKTTHVATLLEDRVLRRPALMFGAVLRRAVLPDTPFLETDRLNRLQGLLDHRTHRHRRGLLLGEHVGLYSVQAVFEHTDAMRWLKRVLGHCERIGYYERQARLGPQTQPTKAGSA